MAGKHVVIADDSKRAQPFVISAMRQGGNFVDGVADNGKIAVVMCREFRPDLVLLDMSMPVMTGLEAARIIKTEGTARHVVLLSSNMQQSIIDQARSFGAVVLSKTNDTRSLLAKLGAAIPEFRDGA